MKLICWYFLYYINMLFINQQIIQKYAFTIDVVSSTKSKNFNRKYRLSFIDRVITLLREMRICDKHRHKGREFDRGPLSLLICAVRDDLSLRIIKWKTTYS